MRLRVRALAAAVAAAALLAACGVTTEEGVRRADPSAVPFRLLDPERPPAPTRGSPTGQTTSIFLLDAAHGRLVPVQRPLSVEDADARVEEAVAALLDGPTSEEAALGIGTALESPDMVSGVEATGGVASVELTEDFLAVDGTTQLLAIAQLVYTLTAQPGIGRVSFTSGGHTIEVPRGDGSLTTGSVSRDSYVGLVATS